MDRKLHLDSCSRFRLTFEATFPIDVFKTRMQAANGSEKPLSLYRVATQAVRHEGWKVMFAGLGPTLIRQVSLYRCLYTLR